MVDAPRISDGCHTPFGMQPLGTCRDQSLTPRPRIVKKPRAAHLGIAGERPGLHWSQGRKRTSSGGSVRWSETAFREGVPMKGGPPPPAFCAVARSTK